jgi:hypothetical protein
MTSPSFRNAVAKAAGSEDTRVAIGQLQFESLYAKALQRKKLFKEYLARNRVMETLNQGITVRAKTTETNVCLLQVIVDATIVGDAQTKLIVAVMQALYECDVLPEQPLEFLAAYIRDPPPLAGSPPHGGVSVAAHNGTPATFSRPTSVTAVLRTRPLAHPSGRSSVGKTTTLQPGVPTVVTPGEK